MSYLGDEGQIEAGLMALVGGPIFVYLETSSLLDLGCSHRLLSLWYPGGVVEQKQS
jgi:hypothetical protein